MRWEGRADGRSPTIPFAMAGRPRTTGRLESELEWELPA